MKPYLSLAAAAILAAATCGPGLLSTTASAADAPRSELSFAVHKLQEENVEGPDVERTYFLAGSKRMVFGIPKGCRLTIDDGGFLLLMTNPRLDGEIHVSRSPFTPESDLATNALNYRDAASLDVPNNATHAEVQQPVMNPFPYNGWKSLGFTWTYSISGRPMIRKVSYINLKIGTQLVVTTLAAKGDAEKVEKVARQFMSSWWVMGS